MDEDLYDEPDQVRKRRKEEEEEEELLPILIASGDLPSSGQGKSGCLLLLPLLLLALPITLLFRQPHG